MAYLKNFTILSREQEERILDSIRETCYTTRYPFNIFRYRDVPQLEFVPLTIFYGGNGSGKTTLVNIIAERLHLSRETVFNRSSFFEDYFFAEAVAKTATETKLADSCVEPEKTHFIEWERVGQGRHRPARSCLKIAIFPKSRAEENPRKHPYCVTEPQKG